MINACGLLPTVQERLDPRHTALLLIDVQNDFAHPDGFTGRRGASLQAAHAAVDRLVWLVDKARGCGVPVIHIRAHYDDRFTGGPMAERMIRRGGGDRCISGTWGADCYRVTPADDEYLVFKHRYSGFVGTELEMILRRMEIRTVVAGGLTTDVCVESTVRDAYHRDFHVAVSTDGTAAMNPAYHEASLAVMGRMFADLMSCEEIAQIWQAAIERNKSPASAG